MESFKKDCVALDTQRAALRIRGKCDLELPVLAKDPADFLCTARGSVQVRRDG